MFRYHAAKEFDAVAHRQTLVYRTNRMPVSNKSWSALSDIEDYEALLAQARSTLEKENKKFELATAKNEADAKSAARRGKAHIPKPVEAVRDYIVRPRMK